MLDLWKTLNMQYCSTEMHANGLSNAGATSNVARLSVPKSRQRKQQKLLCSSFLQAAGGVLPTATSGWILAGSVLAAVRLARKQIDDDRARRLQVHALCTAHLLPVENFACLS